MPSAFALPANPFNTSHAVGLLQPEKMQLNQKRKHPLTSWDANTHILLS